MKMYDLIRILGDRHAGFILGMVVVLNLIAGSLVMNSHPELYPKFFHFDLNYFFQPARLEHSWLYALLVTFTLFGINLLACIADSIIRMVTNKAARLKEVSALLFHVALVITMAAHLYEGFYASTQRLPITTQGVTLPELGKVRVESLKNIHYPDYSLKDTEVTLSFSKPDGQKLTRDIAFNEPAIFDIGRRQVVMLGGQMMPSGVAISRSTDKREFLLEENKPLPLGNGSLHLQGFFETEEGLPYAQFLWQPDNGNPQQRFMVLDAGAPHSQINIDGVAYQLNKVTEAPFIIAIVRYNPAIPLMLVSLILAAVATVLLIRWLATRGTA
ncbi:MAG: hypothetical protein A3H31_00715 [Gallionellales bacterium RIFCSPLOWO2_02_FULL_57_47]|nr:MAG: hypothetical protein A3H31_00715 [Gallionellales bacterium RIFCSPLOWO2_02_FULL_57_47]OGT09301.1 MAG: hypothetical protein A3J49_12105 [Gallionellales bacterium RIFCSPHIGHO2_02_FULL_57_16]